MSVVRGARRVRSLAQRAGTRYVSGAQNEFLKEQRDHENRLSAPVPESNLLVCKNEAPGKSTHLPSGLRPYFAENIWER
jgi:hypothetical protein